MRIRLGWTAVGLFLLAISLPGQSPPLFPESAVNSGTSGNQTSPSVGIDADGNFIVVWQNPSDPYFRNFDASGAAGAADASVATTGFQSRPRVARNASGASVVAFVGPEGGCCTDTFARRYDTSGADGAQFHVNTYTTGYQQAPAVAIGPSGQFVVVWESYPNQDGSGSGIFGQRFDASGAAVGSEFPINSHTTDDQRNPSVAMDGSGRFVVVWQSHLQDGNGYGIIGRQFDAAGSPRGADFVVNSFTLANQYLPRVAADDAGDFVVVWETEATDGSGFGVSGRRFDSSGTPTTGEFRVNTYTFSGQENPDVAMDSAGDFLVTWQGDAEDDPAGGGLGIFAKQFDSKGRPAGGEFRVNTYTTGNQARPSVALDDRGHFVITWQSNLQDGSGYGIFARRGGFPPPAALKVDAHGGGGTVSNANGVLEPGELVWVEPSWRNSGPTTLPLTGAASELTGPSGALYTLQDTAANYGTIAAGATQGCASATGTCFQASISVPASRPATHWDATFLETLSTGAAKTWTVHVGQSFPDVPESNPYYTKIETMLHTGITTGCDTTHYCPSQVVPRSQMAIFLAKAIVGGPAGLPQQGLAGGKYYDCEIAGQSPLFTDVLPTDSFCRNVYVLANENVTLGCSPTTFCPNDPVNRLQMAGFVAKGIVAPGGGGAIPMSYGPDPKTGLSYSCEAGSPNIHFIDVPATDPFCKHVHFLWAKGIVAGCDATHYCPNGPVTRDQMAKFLGNAFQLQLYGP